MVLAAPVRDSLDAENFKYVSAAGYRTRYYEVGAGEPLILFHGGQYGSLYTLDSWSLALPRLSEKFRVIAVDKLGQGLTDAPKTVEAHTFEELLMHSIAFIEALGVGPAHLSGHSRGGMLICAIAMARPDLVKSLLIVSSGTLSPDDPEHPSGTLYADVAKRTPDGAPTLQSVRLEPYAQAYNPQQVTDDFVGRLFAIASDPLVQAEQAVMKNGGSEVFMASLAESKAALLADIGARGLPVPTLHVWGANDKSWHTPNGLKLFDIIRQKTPRSSVHIVNQSGHYVFREQTDEFVRLAEAWCLGVAADA